MADSNGDGGETEEKTMEDDVVLEIVKRLPYQLAVQCSVLNKNFHHWISQPNFLPPHYSAILHCSSGFDRFSRYDMRSNPSIFSSICREIRYNSTINHPIRRSKTLDLNVLIIASCNGLLLLRFDNPYTHYFFNPATSEIATAPSRNLAGFYKVVGLAVNRNWNSPIKLVSARCRRSGWIRFTVVVPSPTGSGEFSKSEYGVDFSCQGRFGFGPRRLKVKPVYAHGSLYWLSCDGLFLVVFDVEKEEARLIDGPPGLGNMPGKCLGFADGEIHLVYDFIYGYDHRTDGWRVKHKISGRKFGKPVFFDGELLLFLEWNRDIGCYDVKREVWDNIGIKALEDDANRLFFSCSPSFVKVFNTYLDENNASLWKKKGRRNALMELQKLLKEY